MSEVLNEVFSSVLVASRDAAVLALAVAFILFLVGRKIPAAWRHGLWMLIVIRLLLPELPDSTLSWQRLLPVNNPVVTEVPAAISPVQPREIPARNPEPEVGPQHGSTVPEMAVLAEFGKPTMVAETLPTEFDWKQAIFFIWLAGVAAYLALIFVLDMRFRQRVRGLTKHDSNEFENVQNLLARVTREQSVRPPALRITEAVPVPAISGLIRPTILLPSATLERLDETELRLVLLHELAHLHRRDLWLNWLLALLQAVHWFNPVIWWAFHRVRVEAEGAADAWVLHRCGAETPPRYGEALLRLLEVESPRRRIAVPGVVGVVESPRDLRSRIQMIARFSRKRNRLAAVGTVALIVGLAAVGLTQAPEEKREEASSTADSGELTLPEAIDSPMTRVSSIEITVVDEEGNPVEGADVIVTPGNDYLAQVLTPISLRGRTDANGKLHGRTEPVREDTHFGLFYVVAFKEGFSGFSWLQPESDPTTGKVDFESGTIQGMVKLTPAEIVRTKIVRPDGSPVVGLRVWVDGIGLPRASDETFSFFGNPPPLSDGYWEAVTDERGVLEIRDIPRGAGIHLSHDQEQWAAFPGYHHILLDGLTAADETRSITLAPAASVTGRVISPSGRGVPNIIVEALEHTPYVNAHHGYAISDADGFYQLKALPEGNYKLFATGRGGHGQNFWVLDGGGDLKLKVGETITNQNFEFKHGGRLVRRLIDEASGDLITESSATVGLPGTIKGVYHSGRTPAGYHENRQMYESELRAGEITYLDIPFRKRAPSDQISGVVVDATGNPVSGAKVKCPSIQAPIYERMMTKTDEAGRFAFELPPDLKGVELIAWEGDRISDPSIQYTPGTEVTIQLLENQFGTVVGRVIDGNGNPLFKARFYSTGQELPGVTERSIETDLDGFFRIAVLPEKLVTFWISRDGHTKVARQGKIEAGVETDLGDIQLETATASVAGRVIYTDGQPASQARLRISGQNQPHLENLVTDTEGQFQFQGVAEGWLWVEAYDQFDDVNQSGKSRVRSGSEDVRIELKPTPEWRADTVDFIGKPAPPLNVDHWYNTPSPNPDHKGKIRMIRFVGKDRPLIYVSGTVKLMQKLQDEFTGKGVEFILVHGPWPKEEVDEILAADHPNLTVPLAIESEKDAMSDAFGVQTWLTVVIDREGKVVYQDHSGKGSKAAVQQLLDAE